MTKRFDVKFPLANGTLEKRTAYIYLPDSYEKELLVELARYTANREK